MDRNAYKKRLERFSRNERIFPGGEHETRNCTACARIIVDRFGGEVRGYYHDDNRTAAVGETEYGHDFAITADHFLVDPWLYHCYGDEPVLDLTVPGEKTESLRRYGDPAQWKLVHSAPDKRRLTPGGAAATVGATIEEGTMTGEKNLRVSEELLTRLEAASAANGKTPDELAEDAINRLLEHEGLDALAARGRSHAERAGRKPSDAASAVREIRRGR